MGSLACCTGEDRDGEVRAGSEGLREQPAKDPPQLHKSPEQYLRCWL